MLIETISNKNIKALTGLVLELWTDCVFEEEYENYKNIIGSENETCYLIKEQEYYIGFVHISIRNDYVEGATILPVAYLEAIYVQPAYQQQGLAKVLMNAAENWAKQKGLQQIASDTDPGNSAGIHFHKKTGFTEAARIVCFIKPL